ADDVSALTRAICEPFCLTRWLEMLRRHVVAVDVMPRQHRRRNPLMPIFPLFDLRPKAPMHRPGDTPDPCPFDLFMVVNLAAARAPVTHHEVKSFAISRLFAICFE